MAAVPLFLTGISSRAEDPSSPIDPARLSATVKTSASDEFQGRTPGTPGEALTIAYLIDQFRLLDFQPASARRSWTQAVPLVHSVPGTPTCLEVRLNGAALPLRVGRDIDPQTARAVTRVTIADAPIVFVGYRSRHPTRRDDFKGADLHGKIAVFLVNHPDFEAAPDQPVAGKFGGPR